MKKVRIHVKTVEMECPQCDGPISRTITDPNEAFIWDVSSLNDRVYVCCNRCGIELEIPITAKIRDRAVS